MDRRKLIIIVSGIGIVLFAFFSMQWLSGMKKIPKKKPTKEVIRYVKTKSVKSHNVVTEVEATGRVTSQTEISLIAEVRGKIMSGDIPFKVGQSFNKGDLILKIDDQIELYNMKSRKSSFLNSVAGMLPDLRITLPENYDEWNKFMEALDVDKNLPELPEIETTQEKIFMASRNILTNYYSIKSAEASFESYHIHAPFDGTIMEVSLEKGAVANPGSKLGKIINTVNLELEVPVEIGNAKWLKIGQKVKVKNSYGTSSWNGKIVRKSQNVNPTTQSINVYVAINSTNKNPLYKGEYLATVFGGIKLFNIMEIPRKAVFNQNEIFIVKDGVLLKREIEIKKINKDIVYFSGLENGTDVVIEPLINATENMKVQKLK
jgi:multidrug efflux pump subunit AcrA (membrane-fusion protein)